jgi:hypothetical protein
MSDLPSMAALPPAFTIDVDAAGNYTARYAPGIDPVRALTLIWVEGPTNNVRISGPITDELGMLRLLTIAANVIREHCAKLAAAAAGAQDGKPTIIQVPPGARVPRSWGNGR